MPTAEPRSQTKDRILIVDDDADVVEMLKLLLAERDYEVGEAASAQALRDCFAGPPPDAVLLDWKLPDGDGIELLGIIKARWPETEVIMLTGHGNINAAVKAVKLGAFDFVTKPFEPSCLLFLLERACKQKRARQQPGSAEAIVANLGGRDAVLFRSAAMQEVLHLVQRVAPTDAAVLITGESGTGKEMVADLIHSLSPRAPRPLLKINCAALPRELIELELFGAVKGGSRIQEGLFQRAQGGTVLIGHLTDLPLEVQGRLRSLVQDHEFCPLGAKVAVPVDCRVLAATARPPEDALREGRLRPDFLKCVGATTVHLRPLRERREDILPLAKMFLKRFATQASNGLEGFTTAAADALQRHEWPGNVRQLENEIRRAVLVCDRSLVDLADLSLSL